MAQTETQTATSPDAAAKRRTFTELGGGALNVSYSDFRDSNFLLTDASAGAYTLVAPAVGIDDGKEITIIAKTAQAFTVTTPSNVINGNKHVITFSGTLGIQCTLVAVQGVWYTNPSTPGITLT